MVFTLEVSKTIMSEKDLSERVSDLLREISPAHADDFDSNYREEETIDGMNRHFRVELSSLPVDTVDERECLLSDISEKRWLDYFGDHVARTICKHKELD